MVGLCHPIKTHVFKEQSKPRDPPLLMPSRILGDFPSEKVTEAVNGQKDRDREDQDSRKRQGENTILM